MNNPENLLVIAGEVSGDMHAAAVIAALKRRRPGVSVWGFGGDQLAGQGVELLQHVRDLSVLGLVEVLKRYGFFRRIFREVLEEVDRRRPQAALLIDYPGFNLRLAAELKRRGVRVIYYVCPQVWAWHRSRIPRMARIIDRLLVIFPFEVEVFAATGLQVEFVGHPLVEEAAKVFAAPDAALPWPGALPIALLPGSRRQELQRLLPPMLAAAARLSREAPEAGFILAAASPEMEKLAANLIEAAPEKPERLVVVPGKTRHILRQARAAWVASGTATLETALMECPMVVVYKTARLTYEVGKRLVRVPHLGMVNLLAGKELCPELIQDAVTAERLVNALRPLIRETPERAAMVEGLRAVKALLGSGGAAERVAEVVAGELDNA
ncbi:MAG TPA: lipid-A-disaccharide synthase [Kiritimatiellia bacterium]|nr:lipid-A-disaccharide synthase [Kiritimatiellia bacterium]HMP00181.1 lipid-A-disaccharide synthase [Kiritimatiellia bacterium]HMP96794.1 lipid-A-disaccharide synthase [Kiritimatiellia bacterium]